MQGLLRATYTVITSLTQARLAMTAREVSGSLKQKNRISIKKFGFLLQPISSQSGFGFFD
ncbi:MAG: hypothetical protein IKZ88_00535 [Neisseriaceae bacterium]|nr:hypothetical protein [Neisseriaceae bacterium]